MLELVKTETPQISLIPNRVWDEVKEQLNQARISYEDVGSDIFARNLATWSADEYDKFFANNHAISAYATPESIHNLVLSYS